LLQLDPALETKALADAYRFFEFAAKPHLFVKKLEYFLKQGETARYQEALASPEADGALNARLSFLLLRHRPETWFKILTLRYARPFFVRHYAAKPRKI
jgi:hypothetical protein